MDSLHILGFTAEQYQTCLGGRNRNLAKKSFYVLFTRYFLYAEDTKNGDYCRILLDENYEKQCSDDTLGIMVKQHVDTIPKLSHVPLVDTVLEIDFTTKNFECDLFRCICDKSHPYGVVEVHMDKFREVRGNKTKSARKVK